MLVDGSALPPFMSVDDDLSTIQLEPLQFSDIRDWDIIVTLREEGALENNTYQFTIFAREFEEVGVINP